MMFFRRQNSINLKLHFFIPKIRHEPDYCLRFFFAGTSYEPSLKQTLSLISRWFEEKKTIWRWIKGVCLKPHKPLPHIFRPAFRDDAHFCAISSAPKFIPHAERLFQAEVKSQKASGTPKVLCFDLQKEFLLHFF